MGQRSYKLITNRAKLGRFTAKTLWRHKLLLLSQFEPGRLLKQRVLLFQWVTHFVNNNFPQAVDVRRVCCFSSLIQEVFFPPISPSKESSLFEFSFLKLVPQKS